MEEDAFFLQGQSRENEDKVRAKEKKSQLC